MKYVITKIIDLGYEITERVPYAIVDDYTSFRAAFNFEIWEETDKGFKLIREWDDDVDGMVLGYWKPIAIKQKEVAYKFHCFKVYKYIDRNENIPFQVKKGTKKAKRLLNQLDEQGFITWTDTKNRQWVYTEYIKCYDNLDIKYFNIEG